MNINSITNQLNERIQKYSSSIENNTIEYASLIIEVGELTVGTEENGKVIAQNVLHPTQFSKPAVKTILTMNWKDGNGENITPVVFQRNDWYKAKIKVIRETLSLLS